MGCWRQTWRALCLALSLVPASRAWVSYTASSADDGKLYRWDAPQDSQSDDGLGGGLSFAMQSSFCEQIEPRFYAERLGGILDCEAIFDAILRGFGTWSVNHRRITFHDMTRECAMYPPLFVPNASSTGAEVRTEAAKECPGLEISVTAGPPLVTNHSRRAAVVYNMPRDRANWRTGTFSTAGVAQPNTKAIERSRMHFNTDLCWYLDASFCHGFHKWVDRGVQIESFASGSVAITFSTACVVTCVYAIALLRKLHLQGREALFDGLEGLARWQTPIVLFFLTAPLPWYYNIYRPCFDCYDFEAAVAHEIGHVLGFDHPDELPGRNRNMTLPMSSTTCYDPLSHVEYARPPTLANGELEHDSIMLSLAKRRSRACLSDDDLAGLNAVYPTCSDSYLTMTSPSCIKSKRNVGALRFVALVTLPFIISFVILVVLIVFAQRREASRFKRIQSNLQDLMGKHVHAVSHGEEERSPGSPGRRRSSTPGYRRGSLDRRRSLGFATLDPSRKLGSAGALKLGRGSSKTIADPKAADSKAADSKVADPKTPDPKAAKPEDSAGEKSSKEKSKRRSLLPSRCSLTKSSSSRKESSVAPPRLGKISSTVASSGKSLDKQLNQLQAHKAQKEAQAQAEEKAFAAKDRWLRGSLMAAVEKVSNEQSGQIDEDTDYSVRELVQDAESAAALLARFWKVFEPVVMLKAMSDGRLQPWFAKLLPTARSLVGFSAEQFAQLQAVRPSDAKAEVEKQHRERKSCFNRLLTTHPVLLDWLMALEPDDASAAAALFSRLADFEVEAALHGPRNPLNNKRSNRALTGLGIAPMLIDEHRGLLFEWMVLQLAPQQPVGDSGESEKEAGERRRHLAVLRQFLRALRSSFGGEEDKHLSLAGCAASATGTGPAQPARAGSSVEVKILDPFGERVAIELQAASARASRPSGRLALSSKWSSATLSSAP